MTTTETAVEHGLRNARAWSESIIEWLTRANAEDNPEDAVAAVQEMQEAPLALEVRSGWGAPGSDLHPAEYALLLSTGGPALRIVGGLDQWGAPDSATLEWQDWGTPWTEATGVDHGAALDFAQRVIGEIQPG